MLFLRILEVVAQVTLATAAIVGALFAWKGWQKEMRGQTEYKLAVDLLTALYRFRDAIDWARNPVMSAYERLEEEEDRFNPAMDMIRNFKERKGAYEKRWGQVVEAQQTIYDSLQSAEVIWGEEVKNLFQNLFAHGVKLSWAMDEYLMSIEPSLLDRSGGSIKNLSQETNDILRKSPDKDKFGDELQRLITEIEGILKPKLKS